MLINAETLDSRGRMIKITAASEEKVPLKKDGFYKFGVNRKRTGV